MQEEMERVERELRLLSQAMAYPPAPPLAQAVRRRLETQPRAHRPARPWQLALTGVAAAAVVAAAVIGSIAPAREAVADFFDRINIFETEQSIEGLPTEIKGTEVTLEAAETRLGFPVLVPAYPRGVEIDRVVFQDYGQVNAAVVMLRTGEGESIALFETNAHVGKGLSPEPPSTAEPVAGLGREAYWIEGAHTVQYYDELGRVVPESIRATGQNTLVWDVDGYVFRIEGTASLSRDDAVLMAQSLYASD